MAKIKVCPSKMDPLVYAAMILQMQLKPKDIMRGDSLYTMLVDLWDRFAVDKVSDSPITWAFKVPYKSENYVSILQFINDLDRKNLGKPKWPCEKTLNNVFLQDDYYKRMTQAKELRRAQIIKENG